MLAAVIGPNAPAMLRRKYGSSTRRLEFQLHGDRDRIPGEITRRGLAMLIEQLDCCQARCSGEHAWWIARGWLHTRLEVTIEDIAGCPVHAHSPLFEPDGARANLLHLSHVVSGHQDGFPLAEQGGDEREALLAECRIAPLQHVVPDREPALPGMPSRRTRVGRG